MKSRWCHYLPGCAFCWELFRAGELWISLKAQEVLGRCEFVPQDCTSCPCLGAEGKPSCEAGEEMSPHFSSLAGLVWISAAGRQKEQEIMRNKRKYEGISIRQGDCPYRLPWGGSFPRISDLSILLPPTQDFFLFLFFLPSFIILKVFVCLFNAKWVIFNCKLLSFCNPIFKKINQLFLTQIIWEPI